MILTVRPVPYEAVQQAWPLVAPFIESARVKSSNTEYTTDQIRLLVSNGSWLLLVAVDENNDLHGAATVNFINYPNERVAFVTAIGGKLVTNADTFSQLSAIAKAHGATKIQGAARESVARLWERFGFEQSAILVEYKL